MEDRLHPGDDVRDSLSEGTGRYVVPTAVRTCWTSPAAFGTALLVLLEDRRKGFLAPAVPAGLAAEHEPDQPFGAVQTTPEVVLLAAAPAQERAEVVGRRRRASASPLDGRRDAVGVAGLIRTISTWSRSPTSLSACTG